MSSVSAMRRSQMLATLALALSLATRAVRAHEHHDDDVAIPTETQPLDSILWAHILLQTFTWGIIFPTGMVLGMVKSRWHVWVQGFGAILAFVGQTLGHRHQSGPFGHNVHSSFGPPLGWLLVGQTAFGIYLRLHIERGIFGRVRPWLVTLHGITGKTLPILAWVQMLFGGIVALRFCHDDHLGQCLAHFIMGSAFIAYGIVLTILLLVGQIWLRRTGRSQEFFDSALIAAWGCVNTFTEHHWGGPWIRNDLQHTTMGIVWWCAGLLGMWLSRRRDGRPKRNLMPALVIILTGYGMSAHPQELMLSTMVHTAFGWTLMAAGAARIIEISFVLKDKATLSPDGLNPNSFQYLPPFLLYASGFLFMGATEEQMALLSGAGVSHVAYILIIYSISFLLFLFVNILLHIYAQYAFPAASLPTTSTSSHHPHPHHPHHSTSSPTFHDTTSPSPSSSSLDFAKANGHSNGFARANGNAGVAMGLGAGTGIVGSGGSAGAGAGMSDRERGLVRDAQEFELDALISGDEEEDREREREKGRGR